MQQVTLVAVEVCEAIEVELVETVVDKIEDADELLEVVVGEIENSTDEKTVLRMYTFNRLPAPRYSY